MKNIKNLALTVLISLSFLACKTALYDHYSFTKTLETKAEALSLIEVSDQEYTQHKSKIEALQNQLDLMVAYEKAKSQNEITIQMWHYLKNDNSSLQQFLDLWGEQNTMSTVFKEEYKPQVAHIFDLMADYETKKSKESKSLLLDLITN